MTTDDDLIAYVDGEKTSQQAAALEILLTDDADLRARLSQLLRQRLLLAEVHREVAFRQNGSGSSTSNSAARSVSSRRLRVIPRLSSRRQTTWWISALAAGLLVLVSVVLSQRQIQAPVVASLRQATTGVSVLRTGKQREARSGVLFVAGDRVRVPARECAVIDFPDGSQVTVGAAVDESIVVVADVPGRSMTLERGSLEAEVRPQPIGNPFVVGTSLADAIVIGTHFMLVANPDATQLTVSRGVVRLIRHGDRASIDVQAGFLAVAKAQGNLHALSTTGSAVVVAPAPIAIDPAPATAVSSTGVSLLPERPWVGATVATDNGLGVPRELLRINGQPFTDVLRVPTPDLPLSPFDTGEYQVRVRLPITAPVTRGDALLAILWLRSGTTGPAQVRLVFQQVDDPHSQSVSVPLTVNGDWRRVEIPFKAEQDAGVGDAELQIWLGCAGQTVELGGLTLRNHGQRRLDTLPIRVDYEGRAAEASWRTAAQERIASHRQAELTVNVVDASGTPVTDAEVRIETVRGSFTVGTAVAAARLLGTTPDDERYRRELLQRFTVAVPENALKWNDWAQSPVVAESTVAWLVRNGLSVRGHTLVWPNWQRLPASAHAFKADPVGLRDHLAQHVTDEVVAFHGRIAEWDVVNDPYSGGELLEAVGRDQLARWFSLARQADPAARLFINLHGVLEDGGEDRRRQDYYERLLGELIAAGAPIDGIGLQCHLDWHLTPPARLVELVQRFARFGKPIRITEFDIDLADDVVQGEYIRDALTALFSVPQVDGVVTWGFWAGEHTKPSAALWRRDWTPRLGAQAFDDLTTRRWRTSLAVRTGGNGRCVARVFHGQLAVTVSRGGSTAQAWATVTAAGGAITVRLP